MVDNYLPGFEMQDQIDTAAEKKIEEHIDQICRDIASRKTGSCSVGVLDKAKMSMIHSTMGKAILKGTAAQSYIVNSSCIRCGVCVRVCLAGNIRGND